MDLVFNIYIRTRIDSFMNYIVIFLIFFSATCDLSSFTRSASIGKRVTIISSYPIKNNFYVILFFIFFVCFFYIHKNICPVDFFFCIFFALHIIIFFCFSPNTFIFLMIMIMTIYHNNRLNSLICLTIKRI